MRRRFSSRARAADCQGSFGVIIQPIAAGRDSRSPATKPGCRTTRRTRAGAARHRPNGEGEIGSCASARGRRRSRRGSPRAHGDVTRANAMRAGAKPRSAKSCASSCCAAGGRPAIARPMLHDCLVHRGSRFGSVGGQRAVEEHRRDRGDDGVGIGVERSRGCADDDRRVRRGYAASRRRRARRRRRFRQRGRCGGSGIGMDARFGMHGATVAI